MTYFERIADTTLAERLEVFGAVLIEGPKWCGKTTTAEQQSKSEIKLHNPDMRHEYLATAATKPSLLLVGENPRLIDGKIFLLFGMQFVLWWTQNGRKAYLF